MTDPMAGVPNELLWACIDYLALPDITRVMGVSKRWQQLAIGHETYWKHLSIASSSTAATQLFLLRLSRSHLRLVTIDAVLLDADPVNLSAILRAITGHLAHVQRLTCWVDFKHNSQLFYALCYPAYNLEVLTLRVDLDMENLQIPSLPSALLMRTAPKLRKLAVQNIAIGADRPSFPLLHRLEYGLLAKYELADVQTLLDSLGSIQELTLTGYPRIRQPLPAHSLSWHNIQTLELHLGYPIPDTVRDVVCMARMERVTCGRATDDDVSTVMSGIDGNLEMHVQPSTTNDAVFFIHLLERSTVRVRSFPEWTEYYEGAQPSPCPILSRVEIAERIVLLSLPKQQWHTFLRFMLPLPALSELRIVVPLRADGFFADTSTPSPCFPKLKRLTLRSSEPVTRVDAAVLAEFMTGTLSGVTFPLYLRLEGVHVPNSALLPPSIVRTVENGIAPIQMYAEPNSAFQITG